MEDFMEGNTTMTQCFDRPWHPDVFCEECGSPITEDEDWQCLVCKDNDEDTEDGT